MYEIFIPTAMKGTTASYGFHPLGVHMQYPKLVDVPFLLPNSTVILEVRWAQVEKSPGEYDWDKEQFDAVQALKKRGCSVALRIKNAPEWASSNPSRECSEPLPEHFLSYARFVVNAMEYFGVFVVYIWNEPNSYGMEVPNDHYFGCWGWDREAGRRYGSLVQITTQVVRQVHPNAILVAGEIADKGWEEFVPGMLDIITPDYFSFHSYHVFEGNAPDRILRELKIYQGMMNCPILITEMNMLSPLGEENCLKIRTNQAEWLEWVIPKLWQEGVKSVDIYALRSGWRCADLVSGMQPLPAWHVYEELINEEGRQEISGN